MQVAQSKSSDNLAFAKGAGATVFHGRQKIQVPPGGSSGLAPRNKISRYATEPTSDKRAKVISDEWGYYETHHRLDRLPKNLKQLLARNASLLSKPGHHLEVDKIHVGDARSLLPKILPESVSLSVWSPPYYVGKSYESHLTFEEWQALLQSVIALHFSVIKPGGFLVINIADILCFKDPTMPRIQAENVTKRKSRVSREDVLRAMEQHPHMNRYQLAALLQCSEQTVDRRLNGNNIRGGKYNVQTRVKIVGGMVEEWALNAGFYPYDRRVWVKDAAWENSRWSTLSYRSVDEFEYVYFFWKRGITKIDRSRLSREEWKEWGARGVWCFPSVRSNDDHEAKFPVELPRRVIRLLTDRGETVLDCFMGSGTTAVAALEEGRRFLGIEVNDRYVQLANKRLASIRPKQTTLLDRL